MPLDTGIWNLTQVVPKAHWNELRQGSPAPGMGTQVALSSQPAWTHGGPQ
jgi:hypothetical protein